MLEVPHINKKIPYRPLRAMPDDFAEKAVTMTRTALERHYKCGHSVSSRWYAEAGIAPPKATGKCRVLEKQAVKHATRAPQHFYTKPIVPTNRYQRDMSDEGLAADMLQRDRWAVFRCNADGHPTVGGKYWMVGKAIVGKKELLERAARAAKRLREPIPWERPY